MAVLFLITAALILYGSLYPFRFSTPALAAAPLSILLHSWPSSLTLRLLLDMVLNVAVYVPFGLTAFVSLRSHVRRGYATALPVALACGLSACVEVSQLFIPGRTCSALDLLANTAGALAGALAGSLVTSHEHARWRERLVSNFDGVIVLAIWSLWQLFPLFPIFKTAHVQEKLRDLSAFDPVRFVTTVAGWLVLCCLVERILPRALSGWQLLVLPLFVIPARILIHRQLVSRADIMGAAVAVAAWLLLLRQREEKYRVTALVLIVAIIVREVSYFTPAAPNAFSWIPFGATLGYDRLGSAMVIIEKAFVAAAAVWTLWRSPVPLGVAAAGVALLFLGLEIAQRYMPGRSPEITDFLLAVLAGVIFRTARGDQPGFAARQQRVTVTQ